MNKGGFMISIPQAVSGIISMFIATLGVRVIMPIITPILNLDWENTLSKTILTIVVYLVISFIIYIIVYGTILGKSPNVLGLRPEQQNLGGS